MTTLQARTWARYAERATKPRDHSHLWATVHTAIVITILGGLLAAAFAIRVLVFVHL